MTILFGDIHWMCWPVMPGCHDSISAQVDAAVAYRRDPLHVESTQEDGVTPQERSHRPGDEGLELAPDPATDWYGAPITRGPLESITISGVLRVAEALARYLWTESDN